METQEKTGKRKDMENALDPTGLHFTEFSRQKRKVESLKVTAREGKSSQKISRKKSEDQS